MPLRSGCCSTQSGFEEECGTAGDSIHAVSCRQLGTSAKHTWKRTPRSTSLGVQLVFVACARNIGSAQLFRSLDRFEVLAESASRHVMLCATQIDGPTLATVS